MTVDTEQEPATLTVFPGSGRSFGLPVTKTLVEGAVSTTQSSLDEAHPATTNTVEPATNTEEITIMTSPETTSFSTDETTIVTSEMTDLGTQTAETTLVTSADTNMNMSSESTSSTEQVPANLTSQVGGSKNDLVVGVSLSCSTANCTVETTELKVLNPRNKTIILITGGKRLSVKERPLKLIPLSRYKIDDADCRPTYSSCLRNSDCPNEEICINNTCTLYKSTQLIKPIDRRPDRFRGIVQTHCLLTFLASDIKYSYLIGEQYSF